MSIKKKIQLYKEFGFKVAFASFSSSAFRRPMAITRQKDKVLVNYLKKNYYNVIQKYKTLDISRKHGASDIIWSMWWQGEDTAPEVVKACFASIRHHAGIHKFKVITKENMLDYIDLPVHILEKVDAGLITLTHLSDIIRFYLLSHYGGMWIDATILVTADIPDEIFERNYYVIRHEENYHSYGVNRDRWITYLQAGKQNNLLCSFCYDFLVEYWKERNYMIDYMLIDYAVEIAYQELPEGKALLDSVPLNNPKVEGLRPLLNDVWSPSVLRDLTADTTFFKLTWKHSFKKSVSGRETVYGHLVKDIIN